MNNTKLLTPRPFQVDVINRAQQTNVLNADKCGLGKTLTALVVGRDYGSQGYVLVVCPKRLKAQWEHQIREQCGGQAVYVLENADEPWGPGWYVVHYELMTRRVAWLARREWSLIIADEAHYVKNRQAQRTKALKKIKSRKRMALTATPMGSNPADIWSILHWLHPKVFTSYWRFFERYVRAEQNPYTGYTKILGVKNAEELALDLSPYMFQRNKAQVAPELPPRIDEDIYVDLDPEQLRLFKKIRGAKDIELDLSSFRQTGEIPAPLIQSALVKLVRLLQVTSDPRLLGVEAPSSKLEWIREWLENNPEETVVIFSRFRDTAIRLSSELKTALCIGGVQPSAWQPFLTGESRVLVGTIAGMAEGLNLQIASTAIFIDLDWSSIRMEQALDRIHRMDITEPKYIINLIARKTADSLVLKSVRRNWTEAELVKNFLDTLV